MKKFFVEAIVFCAIIALGGYGFCQSWRQTGGGGYVTYSIASSVDGKIIMVAGSGNPSFSTNSGESWATNTAHSYGWNIACSADGTMAIAALGIHGENNIFLSTNFGSVWNPTILPQGNWDACAVTADGTKLAAANSSYIYTSTNSGTTWQTNTTQRDWNALATTPSGGMLFATVFNGLIYESTDWGVTWTPTGAPVGDWGSIASSADGKHLIAANHDIYLSTNSGASWRGTNIMVTTVASSADGSKLIAANYGGSQIYSSTDYGKDWAMTNFTSQHWYAVECSADGGQLLAGEGDSGAWIYQATPPPQVNLSVNGTNLVLSWLIPSTNYVLQQNTDLSPANWMAITDSPALNLTNLNEQIELAPTNPSGFFRLSSP